MKALNAIVILVISIVAGGGAMAQNPPPVSTTKVDGTENVYVFRYGGYQSMFIVTPQGVIATDPSSYRRVKNLPISSSRSPHGFGQRRCVSVIVDRNFHAVNLLNFPG